MPTAHVDDSLTLSTDRLRVLGERGEERNFPAGRVIFTAGEPGDGFYVVLSGRVSIRGGAGREGTRPLAMIDPGDFFGEMAALDEGVRSATAVAEVDTQTRFLDRGTFLALVREQPDFAFRLVQAFTARLRALNERYFADLLHHERLATVGRLARATVHDFKNPLAVISLAAEVLGQPGVGAEAAEKAKVGILTQVAQMNALLHELIDYTRTGRPPVLFGLMEFAPFLRDELESLRNELATRDVAVRIPATIPPARLRGEPRRLARLLRNLFVNAVDALGREGGVIDVRVTLVQGGVRVEVIDSGPGISPAIADRLFEPFATHGKDHGTGLGLSICKRIVEDHGGSIEAANVPDGGARFSFTLPVA